MDLQLALADEEFSTRRVVGLSKEGELMVVKTDQEGTQQ
jgi:hypothetical protein